MGRYCYISAHMLNKNCVADWTLQRLAQTGTDLSKRLPIIQKIDFFDPENFWTAFFQTIFAPPP